jgi:hypothetical protein
MFLPQTPIAFVLEVDIFMSYSYDVDLQTKLNKFQYMCVTIKRTLTNKTRKNTQLKFYKVIAVPTLLYGCET